MFIFNWILFLATTDIEASVENGCNKYCAVCKEMNCIRCNPGYKFSNNTCCPMTCLNCNFYGECMSCADGFYGSTCSSTCMENCKSCSSRDRCIQCAESWYDSSIDLEAGLCLCMSLSCRKLMAKRYCAGCQNWYEHKGGCCPCPQHCKHPGHCSIVTGTCLHGCEEGWFGPYCDKACRIQHCRTCHSRDICKQCENEYYGLVCQFKCSLGCVQSLEGPICDKETGHCLHGCKNYTWGSTCNRNCDENCVNGYCNGSTGFCFACGRTRHGPYCEKEKKERALSPTTLTLASVMTITGLSILSVAATVLLVLKLKNTRNHRNPTLPTEMASDTDQCEDMNQPQPVQYEELQAVRDDQLYQALAVEYENLEEQPTRKLWATGKLDAP